MGNTDDPKKINFDQTNIEELPPTYEDAMSTAKKDNKGESSKDPHKPSAPLEDVPISNVEDLPNQKEASNKKSYPLGLICRVYSLLICQLLGIVGIISVFTIENVRQWTYWNGWLFYTALGIFIVLLLLLTCCKSINQKFPINVISVVIFTTAIGIMIGSKVYQLDADTIFYGMAICSPIAIILLLFSGFFIVDPKVTVGWLCSVTLIPVVTLCCIMAMPKDMHLLIAYFMTGALAYATYVAYFLHIALGLPLRGPMNYRYCRCGHAHCYHYGYYPASEHNISRGETITNGFPEENFDPNENGNVEAVAGES